MERLHQRAKALSALEMPVVLAGDYNVIPTDADIANPAMIDDALMQPESRAAFRRLAFDGWTDALRTCHPSGPLWTYWDYQAGHGSVMPASASTISCSRRGHADRLVAAGVDRIIAGGKRARRSCGDLDRTGLNAPPPALVYLHGMPGARVSWGWCRAAASLYAPDRTQGPLDELSRMAADGTRRAPRIGPSSSLAPMGAFAALQLAHALPGHIAHLHLIAPAAPLELGDFLPHMQVVPSSRPRATAAGCLVA